MNQIPNISWKGKTFSQVVSAIKKNTNSSDSIALYARAQPLKHYRKELISGGGGAQRTSVSIDNINAPGGTIVNSATCDSTACIGISETAEFNLTENFSERPCHPSSTADDFTIDFSQAAMARRRVRSSGVIKRSARPGTTNDMYKTSNSEYLESRGLTFKQNQYNYVKEGVKSAIPGDSMSLNNIYVGNCMSNYPKLLISSEKGNNQFSYTWIGINSSTSSFDTYTITLDDGYYDADSFTKAIQSAMLYNMTYVTDSTGNKVYLIEMYYDSYNRQFVLNCKPTKSSYSSPTSSWTLSSSITLVPTVTIPDTGFKNVVGISAGTYPSTAVITQYNDSGVYSSDQTAYGLSPLIRPAYKPIYYKPNNSEFAQQGGVSAGERIARLKYNTITTAASSFRTAYGGATASAYAYNVSIGGPLQTLKSKLGYPNRSLPIIPKYGDDNSEVCCVRKGGTNRIFKR
jgi:hypothetical protein